MPQSFVLTFSCSDRVSLVACLALLIEADAEHRIFLNSGKTVVFAR